MMSLESDDFRDELPVSCRVQDRRIYLILSVIIVLAMIQFETFQLFHINDGRSIVSEKAFNVSAQSEISSNAIMTTRSITHAAHASPRNMTGLWVGNTWIPPTGWYYHTPKGLRQLYGGNNILWVGDSTGRRASMNLYALLEWTNSSFLHADLSAAALIDATKKGTYECSKWLEAEFRPHICRAVNFTIDEGGPGEHRYSKVICLSDIERFFQNEMEGQANITADSDAIIVAVGIWDVVKPWACRQGLNNRTWAQMTSDVIELTNEFQISTGKTVIWRTSGYSDEGPYNIDQTSALNEMVMDKIDQVRVNNTLHGIENRFSYVNWGGAIISRSRPGERIQGDLKPHYGLEPRLVLIEMITNHLQDEGFFINRSESVSS